jgi:glycosyltransferase involved in cell wall biosynthesis
MKRTFSLIVATCGRDKEVNRLLQSFVQQEYDLQLVNIYIIDQNDKIDLKPIIEKYTSVLNIHYIHSLRKGLSFNRNIGLKEADGDIIAFPDDDCTYYPDTLKKVNDAFDELKDAKLILGQIIDRSSGKKIIRKWPDYQISLNYYNFYTKFSSITIFVKNEGEKMLFDEKLGSGEYLGSCEDADYIIQDLKKKHSVYYTPNIHVWHPNQNSLNFSNEKIASYGRGFGAFVRKNMNVPIAFLFVEIITYHLLLYILSLVKNDKQRKNAQKISIVSRLQGLRLYR